MIYNNSFLPDLLFKDFIEVMVHGLILDISISGYLLLIPFLLILVGIWFSRMNIKKILLPYYILIGLLINAAFIIDMSLYEFWNFKLDATILLYMDSPSNALASVSWHFILIRLVAALLLSALTVWALVRITPSTLPEIKLKGQITGNISMILLGGILFISMRGGVSESTANIGKVYFSEKQFLNHSAVNPLFSFLYSLGKTEDFSEQFNFFPEEERKEIYKGLYPKGGETTQKLLKTERPNILIILLESFASTFMEIPDNGEDITPNLKRLTNEGIFFNNFYGNSFRTDRALVSALSGYPGAPTTSIMKSPKKSQSLPSIARELRRVGYTTDFLYGGDIAFTNMQSYFLSTGYQKLTSGSSFSSKEQATHAWGVTDHITFDHLYKSIEERTDSLWHTGFLTLSSHDPFVVPFNRFQDKTTNAFAYTDNALGSFIEKIKKSPAWDNLLIILLADHGYSYPKTLEKHDPDFFHIPMLWLGGAVSEPLQINTLMNQTDLAATLLAQLNISHYQFEFSRDIFSTVYSYPFIFYSYNNGFGFKDSTGVTVFDNTANKIIIEESCTGPERLDKGKAILQTLYDDLGKR